MILERDNYTCQVCSESFDKKHLQAHHITPVVCSPMEQVDIENGICVCKECHINLHLTQEGITYAELSRVGKSNNEDKDENKD
jgi:5-methylcytosine-specific restriction endonuclease McrA